MRPTPLSLCVPATTSCLCTVSATAICALPPGHSRAPPPPGHCHQDFLFLGITRMLQGVVPRTPPLGHATARCSWSGRPATAQGATSFRVRWCGGVPLGHATADLLQGATSSRVRWCSGVPLGHGTADLLQGATSSRVSSLGCPSPRCCLLGAVAARTIAKMSHRHCQCLEDQLAAAYAVASSWAMFVHHWPTHAYTLG